MGFLTRFFVTNIVYVKIRRNVFLVRNLHTQKTLERIAVEPFSTERLLVGDFARAEQTLRDCLRELHTGIFNSSPVVLMHPLEMADGGLAPVEDRILRELATSVGARRVSVWVGYELTDQQVLEQLKLK